MFKQVLSVDDSDRVSLDQLERLYIRLARWSELKNVYSKKADLAPNPAEIAEVVEVPLTKLAQIEREVEYQRETWTWTGFAYEVNEHTIWGATGRILHEFLEILRKEMSWPRTN